MSVGRPDLTPITPSFDPSGAPVPPAAEGLRAARFAGNAELEAIARGEGSIGLNTRGEAARAVQRALMDLGFDVGRTGADGWFGRNSMAGLRAFQASKGLPQTGIVDAATLRALDEALAAGAAPAPTPAPATEDPKAVMTQALADAARDGKLEATELQRAEQAIAARYGAEVAKKALFECFGVHAGNLDLRAVEFLQGRAGSMAGHIGRYQELLGESLKDARILDVNADGQLDTNDLVFSTGADGKVSVQAVTDALRDELKIAKAMVDACHAVANAHFDFELISDHRANPEFWNVGDRGVFTLKPGKKASDAVNDMFKNPDEYGFECATAMVVVYYKAMLDLLGENDFNRVCADLKMGPWVHESDLAAAKRITGGDHKLPEGEKPVLKPGEYRYIRNWDVSEEGRKAGWQGENVIYLGQGKYFGHPFGVATAESIVSYLNQHRNEGSTESASMNTLSGFLTRDILRHDLDKTD